VANCLAASVTPGRRSRAGIGATGELSHERENCLKQGNSRVFCRNRQNPSRKDDLFQGVADRFRCAAEQELLQPNREFFAGQQRVSEFRRAGKKNWVGRAEIGPGYGENW